MYVRIKDIKKKDEAQKYMPVFTSVFTSIYLYLRIIFQVFHKRTPKNYVNIGFKKFSELRHLLGFELIEFQVSFN